MNAPLSAPLAREANLDDKYDAADGWVFLSGTQALVRLPFEQRLRDQAAGLNTAGFISGYRGSPLGGYDLELWRNTDRLKAHHIHFQPGVNEDLAATAIWGSQYIGTFQGARYDGVFGIWYGKTPGVDRSADALRHANGAGTSPHGGVLALCGDDHGAKSSTQAAQSDYILAAVGIPVLYPANVQEILDFGLHGIAMSRYTGCWVGLKLVTDVVESACTVELGAVRTGVNLPEEPAEGVSIRAVDPPLNQEARLYQQKLPMALAYARANGLDRIVIQPERPRLGIITAGKAYADTRQALHELGLDDAAAAAAGVRLLKLGMVWPLEPEIVREFAEGLETILVIEEKRALIEDQLKALLFDLLPGRAIRVVGKHAATPSWGRAGAGVLPAVGELQPGRIAALAAGLLGLEHQQAAAAGETQAPGPVRLPSFCSGCPHNTSTKVPQGSRALAGIGCHGIAMMQQPGITGNISHMGGEGVMWVGQAPFTDEKHLFANLGDGTYFHSGILAIRQAVAARVPITYKLLVNGFVSMTGGQPIEGELSVPQMAAELVAEGVGRLIVVADDPERYQGVALPAGVRVEPRHRLDAVQRELREFPRVSVLIYDQMCATERRRLRKRGKYPDPERRTFINPEVCEGCGDCSVKSNCMSVEPLETELGRKRRINQSSCNKDFSCLEGFCPSFVTIEGGRLRKGKSAEGERVAAPDPRALPAPRLPVLSEETRAVLITGIGGTGVITVGAILAQAAHLDGLAVSTLDLTGLSQKYGAVMSHVRLARRPEQLRTARLAAGEADVLIGCDLVVSAGDEAISRLSRARANAVINDELAPTSDFLRQRDWHLEPAALLARLRDAMPSGGALRAVPATRLATTLMGDAIGANILLLGYAWQQGWVPVSEAAILRAIELNGVSVALNQQAFAWGRQLAVEPEAVLRHLRAGQVMTFVKPPLQRVEDIVKDRMARLAAYQNAAYARRYQTLVERVRQATEDVADDASLARTVARQYYRLLAHKDEYEVARLFRDPAFRQQLDGVFEGDYTVRAHLAAWPLARRDPVTGQWRKRELGPWIWPLMGGLARWRRWRGTWLDPFRHSAERRLANALLVDYEADIERLLTGLAPGRLELAREIADWPAEVRGYGHVREAAAAVARERRTELWRRWEQGPVRCESLAA
ncbi:MAG: indolepyruvate ferredoxin oxidoreductase family protein [Pigmentiphaga sp.]|nr:indolepyruvate ferredoxin oxidoreductase family protein [Pigmentiphaga sp.]